jgi:hypothetical protein
MHLNLEKCRPPAPHLILFFFFLEHLQRFKALAEINSAAAPTDGHRDAAQAGGFGEESDFVRNVTAVGVGEQSAFGADATVERIDASCFGVNVTAQRIGESRFGVNGPEERIRESEGEYCGRGCSPTAIGDNSRGCSSSSDGIESRELSPSVERS